MFYSFNYTPTGADVAGSPKKIDLLLSAGVVHQVDVLFQDGCNHEEFVQIFDGDHQLWPSNRGGAIRGNATVISFREFYELEAGHNRLQAYIWSTLSSDWKEVVINIGVLPKQILQPLSFKEIVEAVTGGT